MKFCKLIHNNIYEYFIFSKNSLFYSNYDGKLFHGVVLKTNYINDMWEVLNMELLSFNAIQQYKKQFVD